MEQYKNDYTAPEIEIILFSAENKILQSVNEGIDLPLDPFN